MIKAANLAALALERRAVDRLRRFPRDPGLIVYSFREAISLLIRGLLRLYLRFEIIGAENLPVEKSFVLVANHSSHLDALCLLAALPLRQLHRAFPVAAEDYFFRRLPRTWFAAVVMNALPFGRELRVRESLSVCAQLLAEPGTVLIIFPEGTRSRSGELQPFKPGIGALVAGRDVEVLPCRLEGTFRAWPKGRRFPRPRKVRLRIGAPRNFAARGAEKNEIASELRRAIAQLGESDGSD